MLLLNPGTPLALLALANPRAGQPAPRGRSAAAVRAAASAAVLLCVAGCQDPATFAPPCPQAAILGDAADLVRYRAASVASPTGHDVTDMVLSGRITGIGGKCSDGKNHTTKVVTNVVFDLTRGPAATSRSAQITYFIAVARGQEILDKQVYDAPVDFPANIDQVRLRSGDVTLNLPVGNQTTAAAYSVLAGFQLTPAELEANRAGRRQ